ncbi:MAG: hydroxymethylbilane synthase, partial [Chlorobaculum sp.]|nr:hydroxymethylbilane synthase [Chlorobaculum sp.]
MKKELIIGTRSSPLALWQAEFTKAELSRRFPDMNITLKLVKTTGDVLLDSPLSKIGDMGLFTKDIEKHLIAGEIDLAVHSLKDVPTGTPEGLVITSFTEREDTRDVIISKSGKGIKDLPPNARMATSSLRRMSQLLSMRPDLQIMDIRGNLNTRFKKFDDGEFDAMMLAYAGVFRLEFSDRISEILPHDVMLPAVGQGALG